MKEQSPKLIVQITPEEKQMLNDYKTKYGTSFSWIVKTALAKFFMQSFQEKPEK
jgi:hypothetical protein